MAVEPLLDQASDKLPQRHARVHVREQPPELLQPLLALRVDDRLQLVAAVAERAHPVGRRRQFRVQVGQHLADLPGALAGRLFAAAACASFCRPTASSTSGGGSGSAGGNGTAGAESGAGSFCAADPAADPTGAIAAPQEIDQRRRCRSNAHCSSAAALSVSEPSRNPSRAYRRTAACADAPCGGSVAVAELAHRVVEQAGEASLIQAARLDLGQVVDDGALQVPFVADQVAGLPQQLAVGEGADGGGDRAGRRW